MRTNRPERPSAGVASRVKFRPVFGGFVVHALAHVADDLKAQLLALLAFAVVEAGEGFQGLGQADEADAEGAVFQDFGHAVVGAQLLGVDPDALAHEEGVVPDLLGALNLEPVEQLADDQVDALVQNLVELLDIALGLQADAGQVDGGEAQVAPAAGDFLGPVVDVAHDPGPAAHVGHLGVVVAGLVVLEVKGRVQEGEVGKQPLGGGGNGLLEQVVVGLTGVVVDAFLDLEDLNGEDGGLAVAQARVGGRTGGSG